MHFKLNSHFKPTGDQPQAIKQLTENLKNDVKHQVLLGVTGSGKTFTMANVINNVQRPTLVISHNKTLAGQLYQEFRDFFPDNAVSYFVSYYDYYQPEAYVPQTDTYIEKEAEINEEIVKMYEFNPLTGEILNPLTATVIYPAKHYMTDPRTYESAFAKIRRDLDIQTKKLKMEGKLLEAQRLTQRTTYDLEMLKEVG